MKNIYNKFPSYPNGTLIDNWFEEEELRRKTGEGRTIPSKNFPKKIMDFDNPITDTNPRDNTHKRLIENNFTSKYDTSYEVYGAFQHPEKKYMYEGPKEESFNAYITNFNSQKDIENQKNFTNNLYETSNSTSYLPQPMTEKVGQRIMKNQDMIKIDPNSFVDKDFMARHNLGKFPRIFSNKQADEYVASYNVPYYKDKEITFWSTNSGKTNMFHTPSMGINQFGRSNGFTQDIQHTKGVTEFIGNVKNLSNSKGVFMDQKDIEFIDKYQNYNNAIYENSKNDLQDKLGLIKNKIITCLRAKGWTGLRQCRAYVKRLLKRGNEFIDSTDFKYYLFEFGINNLTIEDINAIYKKFDKKGNNKINYNEFFNFISEGISDERIKYIYKLLGSLKHIKRNNSDYVSFSELLKIPNMNYHPEVLKLVNDKQTAMWEYQNFWDNLKEDDLISNDNFILYFKDISTCIQNDDEFIQLIHALGAKE